MNPTKFVNFNSLIEIYRHALAIGKDLDLAEMRSIEFELARDEYVLSQAGQEKYLCFSQDTIISRILCVAGQFEFDKFEKALALLGRRFTSLIDVGANIGTTCIPALTRGYVQKAIAVEAEPRNFRTLMANAYLNNVHGALTGFNLAAGDQDGQELSFEISKDNMGDHRVKVSQTDGPYGEGARPQIRVPSQTLDTILKACADLDLHDTVLWMDTQGYEGFVLAGAQNLVRARVPIIMEFWPYGLQRTGAYPLLREQLTQYPYFFNLDEPQAQKRQLTPQALDELYDSFSGTTGQTDLLIC